MVEIEIQNYQNCGIQPNHANKTLVWFKLCGSVIDRMYSNLPHEASNWKQNKRKAAPWLPHCVIYICLFGTRASTSCVDMTSLSNTLWKNIFCNSIPPCSYFSIWRGYAWEKGCSNPPSQSWFKNGRSLKQLAPPNMTLQKYHILSHCYDQKHHHSVERLMEPIWVWVSWAAAQYR